MPSHHKVRVESAEDLQRFREVVRTKEKTYSNSVVLCCGTGCLASGSEKVRKACEKVMDKDIKMGNITKGTVLTIGRALTGDKNKIKIKAIKRVT